MERPLPIGSGLFSLEEHLYSFLGSTRSAYRITVELMPLSRTTYGLTRTKSPFFRLRSALITIFSPRSVVSTTISCNGFTSRMNSIIGTSSDFEYRKGTEMLSPDVCGGKGGHRRICWYTNMDNNAVTNKRPNIIRMRLFMIQSPKRVVTPLMPRKLKK